MTKTKLKVMTDFAALEVRVIVASRLAKSEDIYTTWALKYGLPRQLVKWTVCDWLYSYDSRTLEEIEQKLVNRLPLLKAQMEEETK